MTTHYQCNDCGHRYGFGNAPGAEYIAGHREGCVGSVREIEVVTDHGWAVIAPNGAVIATTEPGEPRAWAESYLSRLTTGGAIGYRLAERES